MSRPEGLGEVPGHRLPGRGDAKVTEPALRPIRNMLPNLGGIDISPMILILLLVFARRLLWQMFA